MIAMVAGVRSTWLGSRVWRGLAPGTHRDAGYFWIGNTSSKRIVLCESAIDAISCFQLQPCGACICISTAGVRATAECKGTYSTALRGESSRSSSACSR